MFSLESWKQSERIKAYQIQHTVNKVLTAKRVPNDVQRIITDFLYCPDEIKYIHLKPHGIDENETETD